MRRFERSKARAARPAILAAALGLAGLGPLGAEWPLIWDFDGRSDTPVAARIGAKGDLWVLSKSSSQGQAIPLAVLLRIGGDGEIAWATPDPLLHQPVALALRPDGAAFAVGRIGGTLQVTAFDSAGAISWSRSRAGLESEFVSFGPNAVPIWDENAAAWRIPAGLAGDFVVISFAANGDPLPDTVWSLPAGDGRATSVLPRPKGGLLVAGTAEDASPPGWWVVALDAAGVADWSRFENGGTPAGIFSGAFLLSSDPVRIWADDETTCGLFSLRLWALAAANGAPLWEATWPTDGEIPGCESFPPDSVKLVGDRILAAGIAHTTTPLTSSDPVAVSFDAATGELEWARVFPGTTSGIVSDIAPLDGGALLAGTLFAVPSPGPTPFWLAAWNREGEACGPPTELVPSRVQSALALPAGGGALIGGAFFSSTADDLILQRVNSPCAALFADDFESGDASAWSLATP